MIIYSDSKIKRTIVWTSRLVRKYRLLFYCNLILITLLAGINLGSIRYIEIAVDHVAEGEKDLLNIAFVLVGLLVMGIIVTYISGYLTGKISAYVARDIKKRFSDKIISLTQKSKDTLNSGEIVSRFNYDLGAITNFVPAGFFRILVQIFMAICAATYMIYINWILLLLSISIIPPSIFFVNLLRKKMNRSFDDNMKNIGQANKIVKETIDNYDIIKSYNIQETMADKIKVFYAGSRDAWIRIHKIFSPMLMLNILMKEFPKFICIAIGSLFALRGNLNLENLVGFSLLLDYVVEPLTNLPDLISSVSNTGAALKRVEDILAMPQERTDGEMADENSTNGYLIELDNIFFGYDDNKNILRGINLNLKVGEKVALVGKSGSGKSSIIKLITGFYDYKKGDIRLFGKSYHKLSLKSIRSKMTLVSQDIMIFPYTVSDNIAFGSEDKLVTREDIIKAAKLANAHEFIMSLPAGYDTVLEENGNNLSGGQKQMISVARAFLKDTPIILLDESTSALDAKAESVITESLNRLIQNKGAIIVSHRLSSINHADRIVVLDHGRIVEQGTHTTLINRNSLYKKLYMTGFDDSEGVRTKND